LLASAFGMLIPYSAAFTLFLPHKHEDGSHGYLHGQAVEINRYCRANALGFCHTKLIEYILFVDCVFLKILNINNIL